MDVLWNASGAVTGRRVVDPLGDGGLGYNTVITVRLGGR